MVNEINIDPINHPDAASATGNVALNGEVELTRHETRILDGFEALETFHLKSDAIVVCGLSATA